jgi:PAS domain S-box-containing protein
VVIAIPAACWVFTLGAWILSHESTSAVVWLTAIISALGFWAAIYLFRKLDQDLREWEQRLNESRFLLQAIVNSVVDGVITLDEDGKIDVFNPTACKMFGYWPDEVIHSNLDRLLVDPLTPQQNEGEQWGFPEGHRLQLGLTWQTLGIRKDGTTFPVAISISDVQVADRQLIAILRDMTEVQQTQEKLQARADEMARLTAILAQTNATLEDRNQELEQFAYVASHDLKAPLRAIANLSEWLEEDLQGQLPEENQQQLQLLRGRVLRLEALINGLLEYSRAGRSQASVETVSVNALLADVIDSLDPPDTFTIQIAPYMPTFKTKGLLLRQVFANLISNAIKHHDRADGEIKISVQDQGLAYEFAVADDGPGIAPEYHNKVFGIFQTLEARDTKESTGVGLAIVKRIVEAEKGVVWIKSQASQGTTFHFTWLKG